MARRADLAPIQNDDDLWTPRREVMDTALPTLMKKALKLGLPALDSALEEERRSA